MELSELNEIDNITESNIAGDNSTLNNENLFDGLCLTTLIKTNDKVKLIILKSKLKGNYTQIYHKYFGNTETPIESVFDSYIFKNRNHFSFVKNLLEIFPIDDKIKKVDCNVNIEYNLINTIIKIDKGQYLLKMFNYKNIISKFNSIELMDLYFKCGVSSTLPLFLLINDIVIDKSHIDHVNRSILSAACRNADIRVLKYVIDNFHNYHAPSWNNENFIISLFNHVFQDHIPDKYILRRIKLINTKINLVPYFHHMIDSINRCSTKLELTTLLTLAKYYGDGYIMNDNNVSSLSNIISNNVNKESIEKVLLIFSQGEDKVLFLLHIMLEYYSLFDIDFNKYAQNCCTEKIQEGVNIIIHGIYNLSCNEIFTTYNSNDLRTIFQNYQPSMTILNNYPDYSKHLLYLLPYIDFIISDKSRFNKSSDSRIIKINLLKVNIKIWLRKHHNIVLFENKIKKMMMNDATKDINSPRLLQKFNKVPPRNIVPCELDSIKNTCEGSYLIREKADGCLVDFVSTDISPCISEYNKHTIKSEFIEYLDLYLIFDINIDNMGLIERYNYIRSVHPFTSSSVSLLDDVPIETFEELKSAIAKERTNFELFLKEPYENYRIYPKAAWLVKSSKEFNKDIIDNIIEEKDNDFICKEGPYINDGLIISPLSGKRELKIKPKSLHTLDLLYTGRNWVDREHNIWNHIIINTDIASPDTIWRCYPTFTKNKDGHYQFEVREYRYDKTKPNPSKVVNTIYKLHTIDWTTHGSAIGTNYFYHSNVTVRDASWNSIRKLQNNHLERILEKVSPNIKSSWLDLGCGSAKMLDYINKYHFSEYVGLDFDISQLIQGIDRIDRNNVFTTRSRVIPEDLNKDWNTHPLSWDQFNTNTKYDYIIANFSLPHFYNKTFWKKLEDVSMKDTVFIFNVVNDTAKEKWVKNDNYLYLDNDIVRYKFKNIHIDEMSEPFISEETIKKDLINNNWKILTCQTPSGNNLDSKYTWYIVKHI
jgi:cyclopropane fatty-acyl-phospholipid synthase-like methyltransferase